MSRIDLGNDIRKPKTVPATVEGFYQRTDDPRTGRICSELADALEQHLRGELTKEEYKARKSALKLGAYFYTPHAHFAHGYKRSDGGPVDSGKALIDVDDNPGGRQVYEQRVKGRERQLGVNMFNISIGGNGFAVLFEIPAGMDRQEAQAWMAHELGDVVYDKAVHERERAIYIPCREYILYIDEELMFGDTGASPSDPSPTLPREGDGKEAAPALPSPGRGKGEESEEASKSGEASFPQSYHGIPFTAILKKYWEVNNEGFEPTEGDRDTLTFQLAADLRHICGKSFEWLDQVIPCYDGFPLEEKRQKIRNALASKYEGFPTRLRDTLNALKQPAQAAATANGEATTSETPPAMPEKRRLPRLIQLLTSRTPEGYKAAVAHAVFPPLATHLCNVRFRYTDNVEHEATLMNCLMGGTGAGKGCIDKPIEHIMADIKRRDKENEDREREWKKDCVRKGDNKVKNDRPEGLVIQIIDSDMTKPALVTRLDEAEGHFVYVKLNELDLFEQLKGKTGKQHFQLMCLAFDPGAEYGQTRVGTQSVTARPRCRFNWNASTTIIKGRRFFSRVLTDGPISRINFCTIPEDEVGDDQPVYGAYDAEFDEQLRPYIDNLVAARGLIDCPQAFRLAKKLQQECAETARLSQNKTYWNLSHRACVIAWLKACVLYVANGQKWERAIEDFVRWSLQYDLWCKMAFFGEGIERANSGDEARIGRRGPRNLLELLPDVFTLDDARRVRRQQGMDTEKTTKMVSQWKSRGYILQLTVDSFKKRAEG